MLRATSERPEIDETDSRPTAAATAARLAEEFAAPAGVADAARGLWLDRVGSGRVRFPDPTACRDLTGTGRAELWRPDGRDGPVWLVLPLEPFAGLAPIALAGFAADPADSPPLGPPCPDAALRAWGQVVLDHLVAAPAPPDGGLAGLIAQLIDRQRVSDPPPRFQRLATVSARAALGLAMLSWVPASAREPVVVAGPTDAPDEELLRRLVVETRTATDGRRAVVPDDPSAPTGWLVATANQRSIPDLPAQLGPLAALLGNQRRNARIYAELKDLLFGVVRALTTAIDAKDPYTSGHSERVARIAVRLAEELGLSAEQRGDLYLMGLLHDVGKIGIEDEVLKKSDRLTPDEYRRIQSHVRIGVHILHDLKKLRHLLPGVAHHHECLDGSGYPDGLVGDAIPLPARILAVADAYDAMSSSRPYREPLTPERIEAILRQGVGTQWDAGVVAALFACRPDLERVRRKGLGESLQRVISDAVGRN